MDGTSIEQIKLSAKGALIQSRMEQIKLSRKGGDAVGQQQRVSSLAYSESNHRLYWINRIDSRGVME